ncbi:MAG TPA: hypothetical protein HA290_05610 [Candidatus Nitrosotenuis sp.]|jgi:hypothetical protein|nr:hypothetical protein [Candidatus Nitrosotenuis sp.]HII04328.1 hypothetical protein [Candidatus Nitrosotenuis sp.]
MNSKYAAMLVIFTAIGLVGSAYAHKSQIIGDYKIGVGWVTDPPVVGKSNKIEVMISKATASDKKADMGNMDHMNHKDHASTSKSTKTTPKTTKSTAYEHRDSRVITVSADSSMSSMKMDSMKSSSINSKTVTKTKSQTGDEEKLVGGITGLAKSLQVDITVNGKKKTLAMTEDPSNPGRYTGDYTPTSSGYPTVHLYVKINGKDVEGSFHPEEIKKK